MKLLAFSVRDKATDAFMPVFFARAKGEAVRTFMTAVQDKNSQFHRNQGDYDLYLLAEFDDVSGFFAQTEPVMILSGLSVSLE